MWGFITGCGEFKEKSRTRYFEAQVEAAYENGDRGWAFPSVVTRGDQRVVEHLKEPKVYRDVVGADGKRERVKYLPSPHRLRDSFLSAGFAVGVPMLALKVLANHTLPEAGDVTSGYVRPDVEALRAHVEAITAWLLERMKPSGGE